MKYNIIVTGNQFLGSSFRAIEPVIEELILTSKSEIIILSFVITDSARKLLNLLETALKENIKVKIIVNHINERDNLFRNWIKNMQEKYENFIFILPNEEDIMIHAKVIISDRKKAVIGSANLTWSGMRTNYEIGTYVEGAEIWELSKIIDQTFN